jgi:hypothetical protein
MRVQIFSTASLPRKTGPHWPPPAVQHEISMAEGIFKASDSLANSLFIIGVSRPKCSVFHHNELLIILVINGSNELDFTTYSSRLTMILLRQTYILILPHSTHIIKLLLNVYLTLGKMKKGGFVR